MDLDFRWMAVSVVLTALVTPCLAADDWFATLATDESVLSVERLEQIEAELEALRARVDQVPQTCCKSACTGCSRCQPCGPYAGFAFLFARPYFGEGTALRKYGGAYPRTISLPFSYDREVTPRVWFGYAFPNGCSLRYRYWQFDHAGKPLSAEDDIGPYFRHEAFAYATPDWVEYRTRDGDTLTVTNGLEAHTSDIEVTQRLQYGQVSFTFAGGVRCARLDQHYGLEIVDADAIPRFNGDLIVNRIYKGIGPTVAIELERPVGLCGLSLLGAARGSVLFGDEESSFVDSPGYPYVKTEHVILGIAEIEIGVQWACDLSNGVRAFARGGYEGQLWSDAGSPNTPNGDMGFEGFSVAFGFAR